MTVIRWALIAIIGLSSGLAVAGGVFAFITMLGIVPRLAARTHTRDHIIHYETMIIAGGALGNIWWVYGFTLPATSIFLMVYGLCAGIYVGCLAMALAEMLRLLPILVARLQIIEGFPVVVSAIALGKLVGTLVQFFGKS